MKEIAIEDVSSQPEEIARFPDYIFSAMARRGIGVVEANLTGVADEPHALVPWQHIGRTHQSVETIANVRLDHFRSYLARFASVCGINPYAGHGDIGILWPVRGASVTHYFSVFLCNEPTMAFWIRIYFYGIDGIYPSAKN